MKPTKSFYAAYRCFHGCAGEYPLDEIIYTCPHCGGLLEVWHDLDALRAHPAEYWRNLFETRFRSPISPWNSGVWGKKEWVNPGVQPENVVSLGEGATPLLPARRLAQHIGLENLWIKQCGISHTGSFKDLGMTVLVSQVKQMLARGKSIRAVACASTGDTSASLAAYCAAANIPAVVLLPENKVSIAQLIQPLANGALTLSLKTDFDGCMALVKQLTQRQDIYLANSMNSLRIEGQKTIAIEICQQMGWQVPDWVVVPGGNLGNISAIGKGFEMAHQLGLIDRQPRLACAQAERANPLYESYLNHFKHFEPKPARATLASAIQIGHPVSIHKAIAVLQKFNGVVEQATEQELVDASVLADRCGLFTCPHTGVGFRLSMVVPLEARQRLRFDIKVRHPIPGSNRPGRLRQGALNRHGRAAQRLQRRRGFILHDRFGQANRRDGLDPHRLTNPAHRLIVMLGRQPDIAGEHRLHP
ncbi:MAG: threonine synthase, partial [Calditrichaeota bacterium]